jgi:hypothetical protein
MEKQLSAIGFWLGLVCTVLALVFRMFDALHVTLPHMSATGGVPVDSTGLFHGATMFFLLAIASWCRTAKS